MDEESRREKKQKAISRRTRSEELLQAIAVSEEIIDSIAIGIGRNPATTVSSEPEGILPFLNFNSRFIPLNLCKHNTIS